MASDERAHWLAVYALGLTAAGSLKDAVTDLATKVDQDVDVLHLARAHLEESYIGDSASRQRATEVLSAAAALTSRRQPPPA